MKLEKKNAGATAVAKNELFIELLNEHFYLLGGMNLWLGGNQILAGGFFLVGRQ